VLGKNNAENSALMTPLMQDRALLRRRLRGVVSFHGLFSAPGDLPNERIRAKFLTLHGHDDPMVPPAAVLALEKELTDAGADWQIHAYGGTLHAFTNQDANSPQQGMAYTPLAAKRAWTSMKNFLAEVLA
jgi:dienelactone hydrolase